MIIKSLNPATESVNREFETFSRDAVLERCKAAQRAFAQWSAVEVDDRAAMMRKLAAVLRQKSRDYGRIMTLEMGKPIRQAVAEVEKCAFAADVYAESAKRWLADEIVDAGFRKSFVTPQPLGVILSIMPWNFPFWQAMRFGIPALTAGNVSILRHSNVCPMSSLAIEESFRLAGFPDGVFSSIITDHDEVKRLVRSRYISGVSLTGSVEAGRSVAALAGKNIKKFVLELGGSDAFIVLDDADPQTAGQKAAEGRMINSGQSCIAAKRFIVARQIADEFTKAFVASTERLKVGDPLEESTDIGPMASRQQVETLDAQVKESISQGAKIETGGHRLEGRGYFYQPTVVTAVRGSMPLLKQEVFGPVGPVVVARNDDDALRIANSSQFGLGASVWTSDPEKGERMARRIEAGLVYVNGIVASDPRFPFGGIKQSGIGRELSRHGLLEFTNIKSVIIK